ncbi:hypothetical protein OAX78_01860 [Planctomycetota bacterium]|nr:hypothetical protein [Planctomycetota bacterium]
MANAPSIQSVRCTVGGPKPSFTVVWTVTGSKSNFTLLVRSTSGQSVAGTANMQQASATWRASEAMSESTVYEILVTQSTGGSSNNSQPVRVLFFQPTDVETKFDGVNLLVNWTPPVGATRPATSTVVLANSAGTQSTTTSNPSSASMVVRADLLNGSDWTVTVTPSSGLAAGPVSDPAPVSQTSSGGGTPALRYAIASEPPQLTTSSGPGPTARALLTLVVSNPGQDAVALAGISVTIPVGTAATDLGDDGQGVATLPPTGWQLTEASSQPAIGLFVFTPLTPTFSLASEGLAFVFQNVAINQQPGTAEVLVRAGLDGVDFASGPSVSLPLSKVPCAWEPVDFVADPCVVEQGGATTLRWAGPAGAIYSLVYVDGSQIVRVPAPGEPPLSASGSYPATSAPPLVLTGDTVFTLTVSKNVGGKTREQQVQRVVSVVPPA